VYNFGHKIPASIHENIFLLNIHFSVLPCCRGPMPVEATYLSGSEVWGLTIHHVTHDIDAGNVLFYRVMPLEGIYVGVPTAPEAIESLQEDTIWIMGALLDTYRRLHNAYSTRGYLEPESLQRVLQRFVRLLEVQAYVLKVRQEFEVQDKTVVYNENDIPQRYDALVADENLVRELFEGTVEGAAMSLSIQREPKPGEWVYTPKDLLNSDINIVKFKTMTAEEIVRRIQALTGRKPVRAKVRFQGKLREAILYRARLKMPEEEYGLKPGQIVIDTASIVVGAAKGEVAIQTMGFPGKKILDGSQLASLKDKLEAFE